MATQQILTAALEVSATLSIAYIALALACFISRIDTSKPAAIAPTPPAPPAPAAAKKIKPAAIAAVVGPQRPDYQGMKVAELRAIAQSLGLPTRATNADRRLNKGELLSLLQ